VKREKHCFEDAQLRVREAKSFDEWWKVVCDMSDAMDVIWVALAASDSDGTVHTSVWRRPGPAPSPGELVTVTIPVVRKRPGCTFRLEAGLRVNGSVEGAGRRAGLLGRLVDETDLGNLPEMIGALERMLQVPAVEERIGSHAPAGRVSATPARGERPPLAVKPSLPMPLYAPANEGPDAHRLP
jgi:hypothetical protein